ncbi:MAG: magnesium chelatase family protein [Actinomycetota bacterium]|jgi:magnesium chelatase family protein|nr:magnesium chelatase family protein [Actinomycetota bacterium]
MALAKVHGVVVWGVSGALVRVEVDVSSGLPSVGVIGLPDTSVSESRWRVRSAVASIDATWPNQRVTISLSPAEVPKNGAGLDLPIAVGVLLASDQLPGADVSATTFIGELGLDGRLRPTRGAMAGALAARAGGLDRIIVAPQNASEIARLPGIAVVSARDLAGVVAILRGADPGENVPVPPEREALEGPDLCDVRGHDHARFALAVAAAGGHHMALVGPPGVGKTMLAERLPGLLPDLDDETAVEVAAIHSVAGLTRPDVTRPPYRAPHHSASSAALLGAAQGHRVRPGAVTLAHRGVLFLDEAPEFSRPSLEGLRQPLESGQVSLHRSGWAGLLPAAFQLVLAANPCPCGQRTGNGAGCSCPAQAVRRYASRLSGPLVDRIDIRMWLTQPSGAELAAQQGGDDSATVRARVVQARARASHRFAGLPWATNAAIPAGRLRRDWRPSSGGADLLADLERRAVNLRGPDRVLRMAWTVADLAGRDRPGRDDVAVALGLRGAGLGWPA